MMSIPANSWTVAKLSVPRDNLAAAAAGSKIVFAGGVVYDAATSKYIPSTAVDIYDVNSGKWTTAQLSEGRTQLAATGSGELVIFAGGVNSSNAVSNTMDIYNVSTGAWTTAELGEARFDLGPRPREISCMVGGGGGTGKGTGYSKTVDVFTLSK